MKIRWKVIGNFLKNSFVAILKGQFLQRLKAEKYLPQIAFTFFLCAMMILFTIVVDGTLTKVEHNKATLRNLSVEHTQKEYELIMLNRRSTVTDLLEKQGSEVGEPEKPVTVLE